MKLRDHQRPAATLLATLAVVVGLGACSSSDARGDSTTPAPAVTDAVVTTLTTAPPPQTLPATTEVSTTAASETAITDADVADLEQQLDEIDELLAGVDADLSHD